MKKRVTSLALVLCMIFTLIVSSQVAVSAKDASLESSQAASDTASSGASYGLASKIEDGNILHCFDWTLYQIKEELPNIAKAGFTSVQTSPLQPHVDTGGWYWLYQPTGFWVGNELGSYNDLQSLCSEADKYGIKVIVDVVANHLAGWNDGKWNDNIDSGMKNGDYFHNQGGCDNWDNRYDVTHKNIGMPDLNSEHEEVQNKVAAMINSLKSAGVDGIRWDAAKHIGLPSEGCGFWSKMASLGMYNYGEILDNPAGSSGDDYNNNLMAEYATYIGVTDSSYSGHITGCVRDGQASSNTGNWSNRGVPSNRIVLWGESHDTFCNHGWTNGLSENTIDRSYAVLAARANSQALYFSRPYEQNHDNIRYGVKGKTHFTSKEVAAVNHFHNAMAGTREYYLSDNNCFVVCREGGAVIVAASGSNFDVSVANGGGIVGAGSYTDEVSGSVWSVSNDRISGHIGDTGIAVIYSESYQPKKNPIATATPGSTSFRTDSLKITLNCSDATSATYSVNGGSANSYSDGQTITIGSGMAYGSTITLKLTATNGTFTDEKTYTYVKTDPSTSQTIFFDNSSYNWSEVYCYMYNESGANADWPGMAMTRGSDNMFTYDVPEQFANAKVLFAESSYTNDHRYPFDGDAGMDISGDSMLFSADHSWSVYGGSAPVTPTQPPVTPTQPPVFVDNPSAQTVYFDNSSYSWSEVYCYMYNDSGSNADWPGVQMTKVADNLYSYSVPDQFKNAKVLFTESGNTNDHRYPGGGDPGMDFNGSSMLFSTDHSWNVLDVPVTPTEPPVTPTEPPVTPTQPPVTPTQPPVTPSGKILVGDADLDSYVTILDATRIQRHLASLLTLDAKAQLCADADRDGLVTVLDATRIQKKLANLNVEGSVVGQYVDVPGVTPSGDSVILNASATSAEPEVWYAWTWTDGEGKWVKGEGTVDSIVFNGIESHVIFVRANPDQEIDWNNGSVWNQTFDLTVVQGGTFTTTNWSAQRIVGSWS